MRFVLYAEGPGEDRGATVWLPPPGEDLAESMLGAGHLLVRRTVAEVAGRPDGAVRCVSPLRLRGRPHRGSDLLHRQHLRQLLTFADPRLRPDLAVVLVDEDGESNRLRDLRQAIDGLEQPSVIGVPIREFEAWLIADQMALSQEFGPIATQPDPEQLPPGAAKQRLQQWASATQPSRNLRDLRAALASRADLERLRQMRSFAHFRDDLRAVLAR